MHKRAEKSAIVRDVDGLVAKPALARGTLEASIQDGDGREFVERRSIRFLVGAQQPLQGAFGAMHRLQAAIGSRQQ